MSMRGIPGQVAFPDVTKFAELFPSVATYDAWKATSKNLLPDGKLGNLSSYLAISGPSGHRSLNVVEVSPSVVDYFTEHVLVINDDALHFDLTELEDGKTLVCLQHNQIIGSHWLAYIETDSIPAEPS